MHGAFILISQSCGSSAISRNSNTVVDYLPLMVMLAQKSNVGWGMSFAPPVGGERDGEGETRSEYGYKPLSHMNMHPRVFLVD
ncbi:hypothetical protein BS47DRAFT_884962 [Hydnum rufescens UP504]|uniref:Uncharacterized protein n=1 Tax=Hydnum rufescens UP504 TaxID=1448309 RepID=A0A9P6AYP3_9AGAM|nr:hypothetical protein BS47DRAFT_884962 [Hydnum rufescens UP504]